MEKKIQHKLIEQKKTLALAESCTGGAIASRLVAIPDASQYFLGSIVAYSNAWKEQFLGVDPQILAQKGAVSQEVVEQMVRGILGKTQADYAVAVSGIAGPTGSAPGKPIGTIFIGVGEKNKSIDIEKMQFSGNRFEIIRQTVEEALTLLWRRITS